MAKISIIVPVYNVEQYLSDCLDSLISQTFKDIEILCVNDGSTDNSSEILEEYQSKDNRIKIINQDNQGVSVARNVGIKNSSGAYISLIDSDDWVTSDFIEKLYNSVTKYDADIALSTMIRKRKYHEKYRVFYDKEEVFETLEDKIKVCKIPKCCYACAKLYKRELIINNEFRAGVYYEDVLWTPQILKQANKIVTTPDAIYYYRVSKTSTVKNNNSKKQTDNYNANKEILKFYEENNLELTKKQRNLTKQIYYWGNLPVLKIKEFNNIETYLLFGLVPILKKKNKDIQNVFLIFNTACFGDVILCNSLCQNIRLNFPNSNIVFITDKPFKDVAKYQKDVDEVIVYDKKGEHKGFIGMFKFIKSFPYKNPYCSIITYKNERNYIISKLLGVKKIVVGKRHCKENMQLQHIKLLENIKNVQIQNLPIKYNLPDGINVSHLIDPKEQYIALCTVSKNPAKDIPIQTAIELINKINSQTQYKVLFLGVGEKNLAYAKELQQANCNFINLVNKTSFLELAKVLKLSNCLISVDTGTMHFGYALGVKTLCVFYENGTSKIWAPDESVYKNVKVLQTPSVSEIMQVSVNKEAEYAQHR